MAGQREAHARAFASALLRLGPDEYMPLFRVDLHDAGDGVRRRAVWRRLTRPHSFTGERGVGKNLIGRAIHAFSPHRDGPNCAALPTERLDADLFGHEKGAFTGLSLQTRQVRVRLPSERSAWTRSDRCRAYCRRSFCTSCRTSSSAPRRQRSDTGQQRRHRHHQQEPEERIARRSAARAAQ
jgi:hypothetical protein